MITAKLEWYAKKCLEALPLNLRGYTVSCIKGTQKGLMNIATTSQRAKSKGLITNSISLTNSGDYEGAESNLLEAINLDPTNPDIAPHLGRVRFLKARSVDKEAQNQIKEMLAAIQAMNQELENNPIYVPGEFWGGVGKFHIWLLEQYGIENFKRTVSHHYQNWFMDDYTDPQVNQLFRLGAAQFALEPWTNIIEIPTHVGHNRSMNQNDPTYPLAFAKNREIYRISVGLLWEYVKNHDRFKILELLTESEIGNPIRIWRNEKLISSDLAHSVRERNLLLESRNLYGGEKLVVGELGAGHGRLAEMFGRTTNYKYRIFDITPALYVSQWYIKKLFPNEKIFEFRHFDEFSEIKEELQKCRFAFFTSNQIEKFPDDYFNAFINMNSLQEMKMDQIKNFLHQIDRLTTDLFLSRQMIDSCNITESVHLSKDNFKMPERWQLSVDKTDDIYPIYFNQIWKRVIENVR
jgi:putative sugar O-methyltransferase